MTFVLLLAVLAAEPMLKKPPPPRTWEPGPKLNDPKLTEWLNAQTGLIKLPVTLKRGQVGFTGRGATAGSLTLDVDDTALGISLADRARQHCKDAKTCTLWLVGRWEGKPSFNVLEVEGLADAGETSTFKASTAAR